MYRDAERREGVARRIRELWEESGYTEEHVADTLGISISGFQKQKQSGGIRREHAEKLAELFGTTYEYIATGRTEKGDTPDPFAVNGKPDDRLGHIEAVVEETRRLLRRLAAAQGAGP